MDFEYKLEKLLTEVNNKMKLIIMFLSLGKSSVKAQVKLLKTNYLKQDISKLALKFKKKSGEFPEWIKLDIVTSTEKILFKELKTLINTRRNYVDFGIAFDSQWNFAVLPEEINANAFVRPDNTTKELFLSEKTSIIIYANILQIKRHFLVNSIMKKKLLNSIHKVSL